MERESDDEKSSEGKYNKNVERECDDPVPTNCFKKNKISKDNKENHLRFV